MSDITYLTAEIVASAAANEHSRMRPEDLVTLIKSVRGALAEDASAPSSATSEKTPLMAKAEWSKLITGGKLKSLIDGKLYSTLKRHLGAHGHDAKSYREAYGLPADFPVVSPEYSAARSAMAKKLGLGAQRRKTVAAEAAPAAKVTKARKPKA